VVLRTCGTIWGTHWELRNPINPTTPSSSSNEKKLGPLGACWLTSLAAKNFYANLSLLFIIFGLGTQIVGHSQITLLGYLTQINFGLL